MEERPLKVNASAWTKWLDTMVTMTRKHPPDPKMLCPYCDTLLPAKPTPILKELLDRTYLQFCSSPHPSNRLGRKAPLAIFGVVCQCQVFESDVLPQVKEQGWPTQINWVTLKDCAAHGMGASQKSLLIQAIPLSTQEQE
ncbi:hypothetical protein B0H17DRAFT_1153704 [Mycena rosella]|uniref:Uncharacterized protein n=1 Tax=Mycena rosella TaxID=1033263 RepID=A0AAD7B4D0_MYCRO|nr:hypothetical protein B0H17DRAFT_1153704 [Mycena rosella]